MANVVPKPTPRAIAPADIVRDKVRNAIAKMPDLISFDPIDPQHESLALRCAVDPGVPAAQREGWTGTVVHWWVGTWEVPDGATGEVVLLASLVLITDRGETARYSSEPAIHSWAQILRAAGAERCRKGIKVRAVKRKSGTSPGSYWILLPAE
jgi:hypothetical protein